MGRAALLVLTAALLLGACTGADSPSPTETAVPSGLEQIATTYLELVDASNGATCRFNVALSQSAPALASLKTASAEYAESLITLLTALRRLDWPTAMGDDASELIYALSTDYDHARAMSVAGTMSDFIEADHQLIEANKVSAAAASALRRDLGLGTAGNPCAT